MTKGCYTCRRRRIICDNGQPTCRKCRDAGKECLGYQKPLVWVKGGVASRGKMMGRSFDDVTKPPNKAGVKPSAEAKAVPDSGFGSISFAESSGALSAGLAVHASREADTWVHERVGEVNLETDDGESSLGLNVPENLDTRMVHVPRDALTEYLPAPWGLVDPLHKDLNQASRFYLYHCKDGHHHSIFINGLTSHQIIYIWSKTSQCMIRSRIHGATSSRW